MEYETESGAMPSQVLIHRARIVLVTFLLTFIAARVIVFLIMSRRIPDLYLHLGGTHVHHLNYGIFLLAGVGAYLLFRRPVGRGLDVSVAVLELVLDLLGIEVPKRM